MRLTVLLACLALVACREAPLPKEAPFDFTRAGPLPADFNSDTTVLSRWNDPRPDSLRTLWDSGMAGEFAGVDGKRVAYRVHYAQSPKGALVILPGRTEAIVKYVEVIDDLLRQGYSTYALTLRGQGEAEHLLPDPDKGHVAYFDDYVEDTHQFIREIVRPNESRVFLLAHSTGGGVAPLLIDRYPDDLDALVLSSPLLDVNLGAFPAPVAASIAGGMCSASDGTGWTLGSGNYKEETDFPNNTVTTSEPRWRLKVQQIRDDERIRMGGLTWRWLCQSLVGTSKAQSLGPWSKVPTLMLQAEKDSFVNRPGQERYCTEAPRCTFVRIAGAKHEMLQERDELRNDVMSRIVKFLDAQVTP